MATLAKPGYSRNCKNCEITYDDTIQKCIRCEKNPKTTLNWSPNVETATKIVLHYLGRQPMISVEQIAKHYEVSTKSIEAGMKQLIDDEIIEIVQTISMTEKKRK